MPDSKYDEMFADIMNRPSKPAAKEPAEPEPKPVNQQIQEVSPAGESEEQTPVSDMGVSDEEDRVEREPAQAALADVNPKAAEKPVEQVKQPVRENKPPVGKKPPRRTLAQNDSESASGIKYAHLNRGLVLRVRALLPNARTDSDAVTACIAAALGADVDEFLTDEQRKLSVALRDYMGRSDPAAMLDELEQFNRQLLAVEKRNQRLLRELQLAVVFLMGDRLNYDIGISSTPSQVDFLWPQYDLLYRRLSAQCKQFKDDVDAVDGRELYEAKSNGRDIKP